MFLTLTAEVLPIGVLPAIAGDLGVGLGAAGLLVSAYAVVVMVGSVPIAALLARWPRRAVLCGLLLGYGVTSAGFALAPGYPAAVAVRVLAGIVHAGFFAAVYAAVVDVSAPGRRGRATALVSLGATGGLALGVPAGTALGAVIGWRGAFLLLALLFGVAAVLVLRLLPRGTLANPVAAPVRFSPRAAVPVVALIIVLTLGHYAPYTYVDLLLRRGHIGTGAVAAVLLVYGVGAALGAIAAGAVADAAPRRALAVVAVLILVALAALATAPPTAGTAAAATVWGFGFGTLTPLLQTIALQLAPVDLASALVNAAFNAGIAFGALLGAGLLVAGSPALVAEAGAVLVALSVALLPATRRRLSA